MRKGKIGQRVRFRAEVMLSTPPVAYFEPIGEGALGAGFAAELAQPVPPCFQPRETKPEVVFVGGIGADPVLAEIEPDEPVVILRGSDPLAALFARVLAVWKATEGDEDDDERAAMRESACIFDAVLRGDVPPNRPLWSADTVKAVRLALRNVDEVRAWFAVADMIDAWQAARATGGES